MKKVTIVLALLLAITTGVMAQGGMDPARMKERQVKMLKESDLNLTDAQVDSVVSISMEAREQMRGLRDMNAEDRRAKMKVINDFRKKRFAEALNDEALATKVYEFFEKQRGSRMNTGTNLQ